MMRSTEDSFFKSRKLFLFFFGVLILLQVVLMWSARIYPFVDVPNHLGLATVYRYYDDSTNYFSDFYELDFVLKPNTAYDFFTASEIFPTVEFGNKVFFCLYVVLLPLSMLFAIWKFGGNPWFAFLSFLFLYNYNVSYGFVGFTIAVPFVVVLVALLPDYFRRSNLLLSGICSMLLVAIFFMHALAALFAAFVFCVCALCCTKKFFIFLKKLLVLIPFIVLMLLWWQNDTLAYEGPGLIQFIIGYYKNEYVDSLLLRGGLFIFDNYALYDGLWGYVTAACFSAIVVLSVAVGFFSHKQKNISMLRRGHVTIPVIFLVCSLASFLFIPLDLPGYSFLIQRFPVFVFLALILWGSLYVGQFPSNAFCCLVVIAALIHCACWCDYITAFNRENKGFSKDFFSSTDSAKAMTALINDNTFRGRPVYKQFVDYFIVWNRGIATTRLLDERSFALRRKVDQGSLPSFIDWKSFNDDSSLEAIDYILMRGDLPEKFNHILSQFFIERTSGRWIMYKKAGCDIRRN